MELIRPTDRRWAEALAGLPADMREAYLCPEWASAAAVWERAAGALAIIGRGAGGGHLIYPALEHGLPFGSAGIDFQTPYGYGGPIFSGAWSQADQIDALHRAGQILRGRGAVAEFVRCHPEWCDPDLLRSGGFKVFQVRTNVECDLGGEDFTAGWHPTARRNLRKAQGAGLTWRASVLEESAEAEAGHATAPADDLETFLRLYLATADRLNMAGHYRFDQAYARAILKCPGARLVIVEAPALGTTDPAESPADRPIPIAAAILLLGGRLAYYHLGASDFRFQQHRPNDLLYFAMASVARQHGCQRICWGGGMSNDPADSLMRFKTHFGDLRRPVFCAGRILDEAGFAAQMSAWYAANPGRETGMFLSYRA